MSQWAWLPLFLRGLSDTVFSLTCGWRDGKNEWAGDQEIWASYRFGHRGVMMEEAVRMLSHGVNHTSMERRECHHALGLELTFLCSGPAEWFGTLIQHTAVRKTLKLHRVMNGIFSNVMGNLWMEWEFGPQLFIIYSPTFKWFRSKRATLFLTILSLWWRLGFLYAEGYIWF